MTYLHIIFIVHGYKIDLLLKSYFCPRNHCSRDQKIGYLHHIWKVKEKHVFKWTYKLIPNDYIVATLSDLKCYRNQHASVWNRYPNPNMSKLAIRAIRY